MRSVIIGGSFLLLAVVLAGCGSSTKTGGGVTTTDPNKVIAVTVSPTSISLNAGDVLQVAAAATNSSNGVVNTTITYSSSNIGLITVSPTGLVCGGVWDSAFVVCNGKDGLGNPLAGKTTITASAQGVISVATPVAVHPSITSIVVAQSPVCAPGPTSPCCASNAQTEQFVATAFHNATDITALVGPFTWSSTNVPVGTVDNNGLVTAASPGLSGIFATNTTVSSPAVTFKACMPIEIRLHVPGDTPGNLTTSATLTQNQTLIVEADITDEKGFVQNSAPVSIKTNNPAVATFAGTTVTAASFGGAGIVASCTPATCGGGINNPVYSNLFRITVPGTSPATTVFATTSFAPASGTSPSIIPIDTSVVPPVAGTAINLPGAPNSFVADAAGDRAYLGTTAGLVSLDMAGNATTLVATNILGKVLAVSSTGGSVIVSDVNLQPDPTQQHIYIFDQASGTFQFFIVPGAVAAAFDTDGFRAYVLASNGNIYVVSPNIPPQLSLVTENFGGAATSAISLASDPYVYIANSTGLLVLATCNNALQASPATTSTPLLVQGTANADIIVAANATGVDIETVTVNSILSAHPAPFTLNSTTCAPPVTYSNQFVNFGLGAFTPLQLLVSSSGVANAQVTTHVVVLAAGIPKLLVAIPGNPTGGAIPLVGAGITQAFSGGMTPDGNIVWVGADGTNTVHEINLTNSTDVQQVVMPFKKSDGVTPAPPDLVIVKPK
jgi:Big-like domain-containing protein